MIHPHKQSKKSLWTLLLRQQRLLWVNHFDSLIQSTYDVNKTLMLGILNFDLHFRDFFLYIYILFICTFSHKFSIIGHSSWINISENTCQTEITQLAIIHQFSILHLVSCLFDFSFLSNTDSLLIIAKYNGLCMNAITDARE